MTNSEILAAAALAFETEGTTLKTEHGDNASCGGAWVVIPGRGKFAKDAKASTYFLFPHHTGGIGLSFGRTYAQSQFINEGAARAACNVLKENGIEARVYSYCD